MCLSLYGAGTLGGRVARAWNGAVHAFTATERRHESLRSTVAHIELSTQITAPKNVALISAPSTAQGDLLEQLERFQPPAFAVWVSSTGIYCAEGLLTADSPVGTSERAQRLFALEQRFTAWAGRSAIVRLGGLFSDERGPAQAFARTGRARLGPPNTPLALIHDDDAAALIVRMLRERAPGVVLGVAHQPSRAEFYRHHAERLGIELPAFTEPVAAPHRYEIRLPTTRDWRSP